MNEFRVHHILCTVLYQGKGYSGAFCENMTTKVKHLQRHMSEQLLLVAKPDMICGHCPNLTEQQTCTNDSDHVVNKDRKLLEPLGLTENTVYTYRFLLEQAQKRMTREIFETGCAHCQWYELGLCSYDGFIRKLNQLLE